MRTIDTLKIGVIVTLILKCRMGFQLKLKFQKWMATPITTAVTHPSNNVDSCEVVKWKGICSFK